MTALLVSGCKVVPIEADRAARERMSAAFDAERYVASIWSVQAQPSWAQSATPIPELQAALAGGLEAAGRKHGRQAGEGSPWTFVATGEGIVTSVNLAGRAGRVTIAPAGASRPLEVQVGPVVSGTALRDSLPFLTFNDFANQIDFAEVGNALTRRAVGAVRPAAEQLKVGDRVAFTGALAVSEADAPLVMTPIRLQRVGAAG